MDRPGIDPQVGWGKGLHFLAMVFVGRLYKVALMG